MPIPSDVNDVAMPTTNVNSGHGFELHALLEWVMELWINEEPEFGQTDDTSLVHDIENVHAAAVAVRDFCAGLGRLIKSYGSAHNLVGELSGSAADKVKALYAQYYSSRRGFLQFRLRLVPVALVLRTLSASNSSIMLANTVVLISILTLYISVRSFKEIIEELIRDKFDHSDANIVAWYTTMLATFPFTIPLLWAQ
ncbi:hypothetical protein N7497_002901, partial [Penicillium chrysogenum]